MAERVYDVTLNSEGYRLMAGASSFTSNIATGIAPKLTEGDVSLSDFELYSIVAQSDFRGGIGQLNMDDFTKYLWGHRIDSRGERATLGVKLDSTQPDSTHDTANTVGLLDVQADLNLAIADEPENQTTAWLEMDQTTQKVAVPFATPGATPGGGAFAPDDLANLVLWLKADVGVWQDVAGTTASDSGGDKVELWEDQSSEGNDYSNVGGTCTWEENEVNSLPAIVGSGGAEGFLQGTAPVLGASTKTIFFLLQCATTSADEAIADFGYQSGPYSGEDYYIAENSQITVEDGKRIYSDALSTIAYQVLTIRQDGDNIDTTDWWIDGSKSAIDTTGSRLMDIGDHETTATLFCRNAATRSKFSAARIVEVIVYDTNLSDADRENVEVYLSDRMAGAVGGSDVDIQRIWMYLRAQNVLTSGSTLNYCVYSEAAGVPNAALANGTIAIDTDDVGYYGKWVEASFATIPVTAGSTQYFLVFDASGIASGENVSILTASHGQAAATSYQYHDGSWSTETGYTALIVAQYLNQHPDTPPIKFLEWDGSVYALAGKRLYEIDTVTSMTVQAAAGGTKVLGADGTDMLLVQKEGDANPVMLIAIGSGTAMLYWDGNVTWTSLSGGADSDDRDADKICIHDNLWWRATENSTDGVFVNGTLDYTDWDSVGTAGEVVRIGDRRFKVEALFSWKGNLYAAKRDGLYVITYPDAYGGAAGVDPQANRILSLESEIHKNNFKAWCIWQEDLYFSLASGVARYTSSNVISSVTPDSSLLEQEQNRGEFKAFVPTLTYLYAFYEASAEDWSQVMCYNGNWHSLATSDRTGDLGRAMYVDSGIYSDLPRIWTSSHCNVTSFIQPTWTDRRWTFAEDTSASPIEFFDRAAGNWLDEARGRLYTSWIDGNLQNITKDWVDLDVVCSNIDSAEYFISVYYREDEDDSFTKLGDVKTEPLTELSFPSSTYGLKLQLRFDFYTNETYNTPQLLGYSLRYIPRPDTKQVFQCQLVIADNMELHNQTKETKSLSTLWTNLKTARDADEAIAFVDPMGDSHDVHVTTLARQLLERKEINATTVEDTYSVTVAMTEA